MKPPKFHVGQAVVCVETSDRGPADVPNPTLHAIYHILDPNLGWDHVDKCCIVVLKELEGTATDWYGYTENMFAPVELLPDEALAELLEALEPVTA